MEMSNIYFDYPWNQLHNLNIFIGGRGTGKTFWALKNVIVHREKFILLRDTQTVVDKVVRGGNLYNPIKFKYPDFPDVEMVTDDGLYKFCSMKKVEERKIPDHTYGYICALSTFKNLRGVDFSDVETIIFDEFIPEAGSVIQKHQGTIFLNMYETVNRNREFDGCPPVKIILLSNSNSIYSDILESLGCHRIIEQMTENVYENDDIHIEFISNDTFREKKQNTFLYRIANNNEFVQMAIDNTFGEYTDRIRTNVSLMKSKVILSINGKYTLLELQDGSYYWLEKQYKNVKLDFDMNSSNERMLYWLTFSSQLKNEYIAGNMYFDSLYTKRSVLELSNINKK